jgi:uncharacterized protein (DUF934 family)
MSASIRDPPVLLVRRTVLLDHVEDEGRLFPVGIRSSALLELRQDPKILDVHVNIKAIATKAPAHRDGRLFWIPGIFRILLRYLGSARIAMIAHRAALVQTRISRNPIA